jgi:hypothetical protein
MALAIIQSQDRVLNQVQKNVQQALAPLLINPMIGGGGNIVTQTLAVGPNAINHGLDRLQLGWIPVDQNAAASFYRSQPFSQTTLTIVSSAVVTVSFYCF